ncbi:MAG: ammonia-forming cytochrome c nitrite reductase subunit c552, partial [Pyramidobacter sp.]|nr:ammonia-forming cytochrome c nitrite reductase subunit c552 [Pyramidobacter sp.]
MKLLKKLLAKLKKSRKDDLVAVLCGLIIVGIAIGNAASGAAGRQAGVSDGEVPAGALHLTGTAMGRNGNITVELAATNDHIYQIKIVEDEETEGIGSRAILSLPKMIYDAQSLKVDAVSGATLSSDGIKAAVFDALKSGGLDPANFGGSLIKVEQIAAQVETHSGVTVLHAADWAEKYPEIYASFNMTSQSDEIVDYLEQYPMLPTLYEPYGFSFCYGSARGHYYDVVDITETGRPHPMANCWTCKTPDFTNMVNEEGIQAYKYDWTDVQQHIVDGISCYNCHANTPGTITVTHTYWIDAVGDDFNSIDAANLACGQCHNEYYFDPVTKETKIAHNSIESMAPETMLAFFNDGANFSTGEPFADWTNPRTGVKMLKVQHPEFETYMGAGSQHASLFTCADCHMAKQTAADGTVTHSHYLTSPLQNEELIANTCSMCHNGTMQPELPDLVASIQAQAEERTNAIGFQLQDLTEKLAEAVAAGTFTDEQLAEVRQL